MVLRQESFHVIPGQCQTRERLGWLEGPLCLWMEDDGEEKKEQKEESEGTGKGGPVSHEESCS